MGPTWHVSHMGPPSGAAEIGRGGSPSGTPTPPLIRTGGGGIPQGLHPPLWKEGRGVLGLLLLPKGWPAALATYIRRGVRPREPKPRRSPSQAAPLLYHLALAPSPPYPTSRRCRRRSSTSSSTRERCWDNYLDTDDVPATARSSPTRSRFDGVLDHAPTR